MHLLRNARRSPGSPALPAAANKLPLLRIYTW
jgi:hypothetical protein